MTAPDLRMTRTVNLLRSDMRAAKLAYVRGPLALRTLQGRTADCDRRTRPLQDILNTQRPRKPRKD